MHKAFRLMAIIGVLAGALVVPSVRPASAVADPADAGTCIDAVKQGLQDPICDGFVVVRKLLNGRPAAGWSFSATNTSSPSPSLTDVDGYVAFAVAPTAATIGVPTAGANWPAGRYSGMNTFRDCLPITNSGCPQAGTFANGVGYSIDRGEYVAGAGGYAIYGNTVPPTQTWTFDQLVDVEVGFGGLTFPNECIQVPTGFELVRIGQLSDGRITHTWNPTTRMLCLLLNTSAESIFRSTAAVDSFTWTAVNEPAGGRGVIHITVTPMETPVPMLVTETLQPGTSFTSAACADGSGPIGTSNGTNGVALDVVPTNQISCTFRNSAPGSYAVSKTASTASAVPGSTVNYTIVVENTGLLDYTAAEPASFSDSLDDVLDDATYNGDATGGASLAGNTLSWSGALPVGETRTITYSVTVDGGPTGDGVLRNTVVGGSGSTCRIAVGCSPAVTVRSYDIEKSASTTAAGRGATVTYTLTVTNTGGYSFTVADPASFTDNLAGLLDDATYNNDANGGAQYTAPLLSWAGALPVGDSQTITYTVTVADAAVGDQHLINTVLTPAEGSCAGGSGSAGCATDTPIRAYRVVKTADRTTAANGTTVVYTIDVTNTGAVAFTVGDPASFEDDLSDVLDNAVYNNDATGGATYSDPVLSWFGPLDVGQTVSVTYSVTVNNAPALNDFLANGVTTATDGNCAAGSTDPACATAIPTARFNVSKSASQPTADPGDTITYTITVTNTGAIDYTLADPASFVDDLADVLDDATYNGDANNGASFNGSQIVWSGPLAVGVSEVFTYTVTINDPDAGNKVLRNVVTNPGGIGGSCQPGNTDPLCTPQVLVRSFAIAKSSSATRIAPGEMLTYSITVTNTGQVDYSLGDPAGLTDDLSDVLDDATYNGDATSGALVAGNTLTWSGALPRSGTVVITYSVTVDDPPGGNLMLDNVADAVGTGGGCVPGSCATTTPVASYIVAKVASRSTSEPGDTVTYTITVTNTGTYAYTPADPATFVDDLADVLDNASYNDDATGGAAYDELDGLLNWSGPLAVSQLATITYSVIVLSADGTIQNVVVTPTTNGNCPAASTDTLCSTTTQIGGPPPTTTTPPTTTPPTITPTTTTPTTTTPTATPPPTTTAPSNSPGTPTAPTQAPATVTPGSTPGSLPSTGANPWTLLALAWALLVAGGSLLVTTNRHSTRQSPPRTLGSSQRTTR